MNSDQAIELYTVLLDRQPHEFEFQSLCDFVLTRKIKQLEVEGEAVPLCPIAGDASASYVDVL